MVGGFMGVSALGGAVGLLTGTSSVSGAFGGGIGFSADGGAFGFRDGAPGRWTLLNRFFIISPREMPCRDR